MEFGDEVSEPVSPYGQYLSSSILSLSIIVVLESEVPINESQCFSEVNDVFLPINPRFSSIIVVDEDGVKRWKRVEVKLKDHVKVPTFPARMSPRFYDECFGDYLSKIAMENFPQDRPLWDFHLVNYPTSTAAGNIVFRFHHSLGDGFSLMAALISFLKRANNPSLPLNFPSVRFAAEKDGKNEGSILRNMVPKLFFSAINTFSHLYSSIVKGTVVEDDMSPIRSGLQGVEFLPVAIATMSLPLHHIKQIKDKLGVTINDVVTGIILLGTRLYMEEVEKGSGSANTTSLTALNTRILRAYRSGEEMVHKPDAKSPWGNHIAFLTVPVPKVPRDAEAAHRDPLQFVWQARKVIQGKRRSFGVYLATWFMQLLPKFRGPEAASTYLYGLFKNASLLMTNVIGPAEQVTAANHPIGNFYFVVPGLPQSLMMGIVSYAGKLTIAMQVEKGFIDPQKLRSHIENAFALISTAAACGTPPPPAI